VALQRSKIGAYALAFMPCGDLPYQFIGPATVQYGRHRPLGILSPPLFLCDREVMRGVGA
jgi:hypothetical protein